MEQLHPALQYFAMTTTATLTGVLFWIALENMAGYRYRVALAVASFLLLSPLGGWVISWFVRMGRLTGGQSEPQA